MESEAATERGRLFMMKRILPSLMLTSTSVVAWQGTVVSTRVLKSAMSMSSQSTTGARLGSSTYETVQEYYGKVLSSSKDLKTSACTPGSSRPSPAVLGVFDKVPKEVLERFYGCGTPLPTSIEGLDVLDLGSGSGRDCYLAAALVGEEGSVTGIDMTDEQLQVARTHVEDFTKSMGYAKPNLRFEKGMIEFIRDAGVKDGSMDLIISNCVVNLSPDKQKVIQGAWDALREGGELHFSDVYCDRRLPDHVRQHDVMLGECLGGALYVEDFMRICRNVGFLDPRELVREPITVTDPELKELCGNAQFYSITYRCFKLSNLETLCEDYGQVAYYKGSIEDHASSYALDDHHVFETGRPMLVCGNTASMVGETWLKKHFDIVGDRETHFGLFDCGTPATATAPSGSSSSPQGGACC